MSATQPLEAKDFDPESLLGQCSGLNKKTKQRCATLIGQSSRQNIRPKYLPTCASHRKQQVHAGWCQARKTGGDICGKLFRWKPQYPQLCADHREHVDPNITCYFLKLPTELRQEIIRYLLPARAIDSTVVHQSTGSHSGSRPIVLQNSLRTVFPTPLLYLYLGFNREVYEEIRDLFYNTVTFTIDISREGVMLCGRRILRPKGADGSSYYSGNQRENDRFIQNFAWTAVKNYSVNITVEKRLNVYDASSNTLYDWDEEVELYDLRDFVGVVVSGVLAKSRQLCKLQVRLNLLKFNWSRDLIMSNTELLVGPFERLRCVRQPHLVGVFDNAEPSCAYGQRHRPCNNTSNRCITPTLPDVRPTLGPGTPIFDAFATEWKHRIASQGPYRILSRPPIRSMFTEFKAFHNKLAYLVPALLQQRGRNELLHRARVAREHEDIVGFRAVRADLMQHWYQYLERQENERNLMNAALSRMFDTDTYPQDHQHAPSTELRQRKAVFVDLT